MITNSLNGVGAGKRNITPNAISISLGEHGLHNPHPFIPGLMAARCGKPFAGTNSKINYLYRHTEDHRNKSFRVYQETPVAPLGSDDP